MRAKIQDELNRELDKAIADYNQAIRLSPGAEAYSGRSRTWLAKKEFDKAIADCTQALRLDPSSWSACDNRGFAWLRKKEFDKAIADFNEAIRLNPTDSEAHAYRGVAWRFKQDYDKAIADYTEAIRLNPSNPDFHGIRASAWLAKNDYNKGIADYTEAIRLAPDSASSYTSRARAFWQAGRYQESLADEKHFLEKQGWRDKSSPYAAILGHFAARRAGKADEARAFLDDLKAKGDTAAWPYPVARYLQGELGETGLLILSIDNDRLTESHCYLGLDLLIKGKVEEAKTHFLWVKEHGNRGFTEYAIALAELDRMNSAKPVGTKP
jgi:tetratricopeptide (TPR) repeat protein